MGVIIGIIGEWMTQVTEITVVIPRFVLPALFTSLNTVKKYVATFARTPLLGFLNPRGCFYHIRTPNISKNTSYLPIVRYAQEKGQQDSTRDSSVKKIA